MQGQQTGAVPESELCVLPTPSHLISYLSVMCVNALAIIKPGSYTEKETVAFWPESREAEAGLGGPHETEER